MIILKFLKDRFFLFAAIFMIVVVSRTFADDGPVHRFMGLDGPHSDASSMPHVTPFDPLTSVIEAINAGGSVRVVIENNAFVLYDSSRPILQSAPLTTPILVPKIPAPILGFIAQTRLDAAEQFNTPPTKRFKEYLYIIYANNVAALTGDSSQIVAIEIQIVPPLLREDSAAQVREIHRLMSAKGELLTSTTLTCERALRGLVARKI